MARYVIDVGCAVRLAERGETLRTAHELMAPTLLRSLVLDHLYRQGVTGQCEDAAAREINARFAKLKVRYLGDAVLRRRAWDIARALDLPSTFDAETIALTELQADALVTADEALAELAAQRVRVKPVAVLLAGNE